MAKKRKRLGAEIPTASMADIAFLLLIFFLVTTTIATDRGLTLQLPPKPDPNQPPPDITKNKRNIFKILVNSQDRLLVEDMPLTDVEEIKPMVKEFILNYGQPSDAQVQVFSTLPAKLKQLSLQNPESSDHPEEAVISFKADRGTSYEMYLAVLDQLQGAYYEIYAERVGVSPDKFRNLDRKKPEERDLYDVAREGIPMNISIAEPTKIGGN
jgi:biopolymer transport protein ExbD